MCLTRSYESTGLDSLFADLVSFADSCATYYIEQLAVIFQQNYFYEYMFRASDAAIGPLPSFSFLAISVNTPEIRYHASPCCKLDIQV